MSSGDLSATLHEIADNTELAVATLRGSAENLEVLLIELGEILVGSHKFSPANAAYDNIQITGRALAEAIDRADRSADLTRAYANIL